MFEVGQKVITKGGVIGTVTYVEDGLTCVDSGNGIEQEFYDETLLSPYVVPKPRKPAEPKAATPEQMRRRLVAFAMVGMAMRQLAEKNAAEKSTNPELPYAK